jgi:hypothetical protein
VSSDGIEPDKRRIADGFYDIVVNHTGRVDPDGMCQNKDTNNSSSDQTSK